MGALPEEKVREAGEERALSGGRLIVLNGGLDRSGRTSVRQQRGRGKTNGIVPVDLTDVVREAMKHRKRRAQVRWTEQLRQVLAAAYSKGGTSEAKGQAGGTACLTC
jgi:hypothetical protein